MITRDLQTNKVLSTSAPRYRAGEVFRLSGAPLKFDKGSRVLFENKEYYVYEVLEFTSISMSQLRVLARKQNRSLQEEVMALLELTARTGPILRDPHTGKLIR